MSWSEIPRPEINERYQPTSAMLCTSFTITRRSGSKNTDSIYSMRSTFIENNLVAGMDIFLLARICGHSVQMLTKHYERIDIRMRAEEITHINFGNKRQNGGMQVQLFE